MDKKANKKAGTAAERKPRSVSKGDAGRTASKSKGSKSKGKEEGKRRSTSRASVGKRSASRASVGKGGKKGAGAAASGKKGGKASAQSKKPVDAKKDDSKKEESKSTFYTQFDNQSIGKSAKKGKKAKEEEDDGKLKPTRPTAAYIFFSTEMVPKLKKDEGIAHRDAMSKAGALWNELTEEKKAPYNKMHDEDVKR